MISRTQIEQAMRALGIKYELRQIRQVVIGLREVEITWMATNDDGVKTWTVVTETHPITWKEKP